MKKLRKIIGPVTAAVAMVSLLFNFTACNTGSPLSSTDESPFAQDNVQLIDLGDAFASLNKGNLEVSAMVTQADGGELILEYKGIENNNGDVYCKIILKVFPETISRDEELSLSLDDQNLNFVFGPHGITFSTPALLNIEAKGVDLSNVNLETLGIYYDNPETGQWERMEGGDIIVKQSEDYLKIIDVEIPHFSRYACAWSG